MNIRKETWSTFSAAQPGQQIAGGNVPLPVIAEILGHAATETTSLYLTIDIDQLRRCALEV